MDMSLSGFFCNPETETELPIHGYGTVIQQDLGYYSIQKGEEQFAFFSIEKQTKEGRATNLLVGNGDYFYFTFLKNIDFGFTEEDPLSICFLDLNGEEQKVRKGKPVFLKELAWG